MYDANEEEILYNFILRNGSKGVNI